jgi:tetratricopeptide (TPR) repeat protein
LAHVRSEFIIITEADSYELCRRTAIAHEADGNYTDARELFTACLNIASRIGDREACLECAHQIGYCNLNLGFALQDSGRFTDALPFFERALACATAAGDSELATWSEELIAHLKTDFATE